MRQAPSASRKRKPQATTICSPGRPERSARRCGPYPAIMRTLVSSAIDHTSAQRIHSMARGMYHKYFGPDYYSFNYGGIHFVGLNTADIDDQSYYGHVDSLQLVWLARDLALVPAEMPVVSFDHIPFLSTLEGMNGYMDRPPAPSLITVRGKTVFRHTVSNAAEVLAVLRQRHHVLALGGHFHAAEKVVHEIDGQRTRFNLAAAIVGPSISAGLHFPSGITMYTVRDGVIDDGRFIPLGIP